MADSGFETQTFEFTEEEKLEIRQHIAKYPDSKSAVMPLLWMAQEKFGWLSQNALELVARELDLSYSHVYGVASFYTMYFKKEVPRYLFDICTCFTCGECGGNDMLQHAKEYLKTDENGFSEDGLFWVRPAECLASCDTAPMMQVANRPFVHKLTKDKLENTIDDIRQGKIPEYEKISLIDQSKLFSSASSNGNGNSTGIAEAEVKTESDNPGEPEQKSE